MQNSSGPACMSGMVLQELVVGRALSLLSKPGREAWCARAVACVAKLQVQSSNRDGLSVAEPCSVAPGQGMED